MAAPCKTRTIAWSSPVLAPQPTTGSGAGVQEATPAAAPVPAGVFLAVFGASWLHAVGSGRAFWNVM